MDSADLEAMKQEILREMRKEINKAKLEIIDGKLLSLFIKIQGTVKLNYLLTAILLIAEPIEFSFTLKFFTGPGKVITFFFMRVLYRLLGIMVKKEGGSDIGLGIILVPKVFLTNSIPLAFIS